MPVVDGKRVSLRTGKATGRPAAEYPVEWENYYRQWKDGNITATKAMEELKLTRTTFYKLVKRFEAGN